MRSFIMLRRLISHGEMARKRRRRRRRKGIILSPPPSSSRFISGCFWIVSRRRRPRPEQRRSILSTGSSSSSIEESWENAPELFMSMVLEKLPLPDYIRFGAVCKRWKGIQASHILACRPYPPPLPPVPWFVFDSRRSHITSRVEDVASPFERRRWRRRTYNLPIPSILPRSGRRMGYLGNCTGWHLLYNGYVSFFLLNPISRRLIVLPPLHRLCNRSFLRYGLGRHHQLFKFFASPPLHYAACICTRTELLLIREEDKEWTRIAAFVFNNNPRNRRPVVFQESPDKRLPLIRPVSFGGNLYCLVTTKHNWNVYVIYPRPSPTTHEFDMDTSQLPIPNYDDETCVYQHLLESSGELFLVLQLSDDRFKTCHFQVFKADFFAKMWIRMESLGDRSLVIAKYKAFSLPSSCLDSELRENCIYFCPFGLHPTWKMFDLGSGEERDCPFLGPRMVGFMFVPTLC